MSEADGALIQTLQYEVPSALEEIPQATKRVFDFFAGLNLNESDCFDIRLCFEEILINAMKHGNGYRREIPVRVTLIRRGSEISIQVQDQGKGFDATRVKDPTICDNIEAYSGRGVYLVKNLMDEVDYGANGSTVKITKLLKN
ncbi:MAG: ATP-binding protein [Candidatus Omnitrophica bacterium]|jgi:anti-sigma regulatory factor (Ser/Thr protein kinase)|nr:ATP-binding protein [Candidatus Omnitrophota bacterium]